MTMYDSRSLVSYASMCMFFLLSNLAVQEALSWISEFSQLGGGAKVALYSLVGILLANCLISMTKQPPSEGSVTLTFVPMTRESEEEISLSEEKRLQSEQQRVFGDAISCIGAFSLLCLVINFIDMSDTVSQTLAANAKTAEVTACSLGIIVLILLGTEYAQLADARGRLESERRARGDQGTVRSFQSQQSPEQKRKLGSDGDVPLDSGKRPRITYFAQNQNSEGGRPDSSSSHQTRTVINSR